MAEEQKRATPPVDANPNAQSENDLKQVLQELKAQGPKETELKADVDVEMTAPEPSENNDAAGTNGKASEEGAGDDAEAKEEARIIAAAAKMGQDAEAKNENKDEQKGTGRNHRQSSRGGRGGIRQRVNYRDNIKSDVSTLKETNDPDEIRKQVEFYFSDSNLVMDKFLLSKVGGSENRPVELSLLHSFKRMRRFQPFSAVVDALKASKTLELTNDNTCVKRKIPLPEIVKESVDPTAVKVFEDRAMQRSIYAKGFGPEEPSTQFDIEAFFTPYGPTNAIRLRRTPEKIFKGSVFVEFDSEETQKAFLALDPKPKWKGTTELLIKSKKDYCDEKIKEIEAGRLKPNAGRGRGGHHRGRGGSSNQHDRRKDDHKKGFKGGKGGRGGQRGGRGGGRTELQKDARGVPVIQVSPTEKPPATNDDSTTKNGQKRAREDGDAAANGSGNSIGNGNAVSNGAGPAAESGAPPAKKVDVKES
ncbi:RNA-binding La domain-containing protein [Paracoccidioides lutzii Pb01]|uniref:RNA-binding La domain-containing protein n=1 Tax=Paracoccidioides lutzii (strain ATCC MYA-826 / Pb01) TaxID=502779 RepID=C1HA24_PARBA|nr:RNA-binding La domain-containing protein [Paracoccidioides lutzii Pb01]EEH37197.1 RNA-binding La domain-containing protein [Paracoccidioides lutzii Pb01]